MISRHECRFLLVYSLRHQGQKSLAGQEREGQKEEQKSPTRRAEKGEPLSTPTFNGDNLGFGDQSPMPSAKTLRVIR